MMETSMAADASGVSSELQLRPAHGWDKDAWWAALGRAVGMPEPEWLGRQETSAGIWVTRFAVESRSEPARRRTVLVALDRTAPHGQELSFGCDCPGAHHGRLCWHVARVALDRFEWWLRGLFQPSGRHAD